MRRHIERALSATHGRIEGRFGAAKILGINRKPCALGWGS